VAGVKSDVTEECVVSIIRVERISDLETLALTLVLTRATQSHIPEDGILHSDGRENIKSHVILFLGDTGEINLSANFTEIQILRNSFRFVGRNVICCPHNYHVCP
jgi:hypothetical protein